MAIENTLLTADDLFYLPDDGLRHELVEGELTTMPPSGSEHGFSSAKLVRFLDEFVDAHRLGSTYGAETGFRIFHDPDTVRAPDAAFVANGRFPDNRPPRGYPDLAPDLVAEVVSPSDSAREVEEKVHDWLRAGVRLVWVVHPSTRSVTVYRSLSDIRILTEQDSLDGFDVLPGFACPVRNLFPR